jgi:hypothetical protein
MDADEDNDTPVMNNNEDDDSEDTDDETDPPETDPPESLVASLTPYPLPDPTQAPMPVPSSKATGLTLSSELVGGGAAQNGAKDTEYDGPDKTGKTLKDLAMDLGAPDSVGTLLDDMQDAVLGIVGDLVNPNPERTSLAEILGHENRLRGIGALCVLVAIIGIVLDSAVGSSLKAVSTE